jgi:hypothetical protein
LRHDSVVDIQCRLHMANHTGYMAVRLLARFGQATCLPPSQARGSKSRPVGRVGAYHKGVAIPAARYAPTPPREPTMGDDVTAERPTLIMMVRSA